MQKVMILEGLDCPNCAMKVQDAVQKLPAVETANVDFSTTRLTVSIKPEHAEETIQTICKKIHALESQILIRDEADGKILLNSQSDHEHTPDENTHDHGHSHAHTNGKSLLLRIGVSLIFFLAALLSGLEGIPVLCLYIIAYLIIGADVLFNALRNLIHLRPLDESFLMSAATIGAFCIREYPEAVLVMLLYQLGEYLQSLAVQRSRKSIEELMDIRPDTANLEQNGEIVSIHPSSVHPGQQIIVRPGERIPLDGTIIEGNSSLDTAALTGESVPKDVKPGDSALSGSVNLSHVLRIRVEKDFQESTVSKILHLVREAGSRKSKTENFITKFARWYTPTVVLAAIVLAIFPPLLGWGDFSAWLHQALVFLVISCPCALVISVPLSFFSGLGAASRQGVLIKGSNYLEALTKIKTVIFDKTGTLTEGVFAVTAVEGAPELLEYAALAESYSTHPIARSICHAYTERGNQIEQNRITDYQEFPGKGIQAVIDGKTILAGNQVLLNDIVFEQPDIPGSVVYVAADHQYLGYIAVSDRIKKDSQQTISDLRSLGVQNIIMLTGDTHASAQKTASELGIDQVYAELLPTDKVEKAEKIKAQSHGTTVFVGDGINDAPVLALSDIGIAMGGVGSDAAIEAADVVLMKDEPSALCKAIRLSRYTRRIVTQNITFALAVKALVLVLGFIGKVNMWAAVFADVGVTLLAVLNAMRITRYH
ncbi:MAG TPA: cadmium-translocating P-type ATPase [Firmicutes bacterium]|nr:cadmium-translocating P-type ATPase [Bacillota bacterium]